MTDSCSPDMAPLAPEELAGLRAVQGRSMFDGCIILRYSTLPATPYNAPVGRWTADAAIVACGLSLTTPREVMRATEVALIDAELRLPIGTALRSTDRVRIVRRHGEPVEPVDYEVIGEPKRGPSALLVGLRTVSDGSGGDG